MAFISHRVSTTGIVRCRKNYQIKPSSMMGVEEKEKKLLGAYDLYADALFRHCYFRLYDRELAKDVVQDVFMRAWEYTTANNEIVNMRAFLYRTANNLVIDTFRKQKTYSLDELKEKGFDPKDESADTSRIVDIISGKEVLQVLHRLEEPYRAVVVMRYIDNLLPREIAIVLGESENAVSVRIHRAIKKVKQLWENGIHEV